MLKLNKNNTTIKTEILAGLTTFMTITSLLFKPLLDLVLRNKSIMNMWECLYIAGDRCLALAFLASLSHLLKNSWYGDLTASLLQIRLPIAMHSRILDHSRSARRIILTEGVYSSYFQYSISVTRYYSTFLWCPHGYFTASGLMLLNIGLDQCSVYSRCWILCIKFLVPPPGLAKTNTVMESSVVSCCDYVHRTFVIIAGS